LDWLLLARGVIARRFAWFFQGTKVIFFIFLIYVGVRYGDIKFSTNPQDTPEYSDLNFFTMSFTTGVGVGFFVYGVAEPLWHQSSHFFERAGVSHINGAVFKSVGYPSIQQLTLVLLVVFVAVVA
jgi:choline-glycine betaine transporter